MAHNHQAEGESPPGTDPCVSLRMGGGFGVASCLRSSWMLEVGAGVVDQGQVGMQQTVGSLRLIAPAEMGSAEVCWMMGWT